MNCFDIVTIVASLMLFSIMLSVWHEHSFVSLNNAILSIKKSLIIKILHLYRRITSKN